MGNAFIILIVLIAAASQFASDMYLPSLPHIQQALNTTEPMVGLSITVFLLGQAIFQWVFGPLSEKHGRRQPILWGIVICFIGTLVCIVSEDIQFLLIGRFLQGCGAAALMCVAFATIRDAFAGHAFAKAIAIVNMTFSIVFAAAPAIGGYLQELFGWEASFEATGLYLVAILIISYFFLPETHHPEKRDANAAKLSGIWKNSKALVKSKIFMGYSLSLAFCYSIIVVYATTTPFLFQKVLHLTPIQYGWLAIVNAAALIMGSWAVSKLLHRYSMNKLFEIGLFLILIPSIIMLLLALLNFVEVWSIMTIMFIALLGVAFIASTGSTIAMDPFGHIAGTAGAMILSIQMLSGFLVGTLSSLFHATTQLPLALSMFIIAIASFFLFKMGKKEYELKI